MSNRRDDTKEREKRDDATRRTPRALFGVSAVPRKKTKPACACPIVLFGFRTDFGCKIFFFGHSKQDGKYDVTEKRASFGLLVESAVVGVVRWIEASS